ncbi:MAG TPA: hypothetical protein VNG13_13735 [Mycobacteriales bacterium]|nr:hypothetical protein [Mycobacteriales bacterium]
MTADDIRTDAVRGLATVALLKANFDSGRDHISMFEPFVIDTLATMDLDGASVEDVQRALRHRHRLSLPLNTLKTLLGRAKDRRLLRRDGGRYFRTAGTPTTSDLLERCATIEERQRRLAEALIDKARQLGLGVASVEDALAMILSFLERFHVALALDAQSRLRPVMGDDLDSTGPLDAQSSITARFIYDELVAASPLSEIIEEMLEGFVLQNALLLKDISLAGRRFQGLHVFFDSRLLFRALGHNGPAAERATLELIALLRDTGAILNLFTTTVREMRAILSVYEDKLATAKGRAELYATPMTRHFLTTGQSPSDIRVQASLIERRLASLGFNVRDLPAHEARFTLDEAKLAKSLAGSSGNDHSQRVIHDVDCVAGVLTWRRGMVSESWDTARAVFVTTSGETIDSVAQWYQDEGGQGLPPIVHHLYLSNLAWLKKPASAAKLKVNELIAVCVAALRPSKPAWKAFVAHLRKLEASGILVSDEVTAILASGLTDRILVDAEVDEDSDADSLNEVVERVKETYRQEATVEVNAAKQAALEHQAEAARLRTQLRSRAHSVARVVSWSLALVLGASFIAGTVLSVVSGATSSSPDLWAILLAAVPLAIAALLGVLWGFNLKSWRVTLELRLSDVIASWLQTTPQ